MTGKREALEPILEKVGKLFAMLGSDNPGERTNALEKMVGILKNAGLDLHDLWQLGWSENKDEIAALLAALFADDVDLLLKIGRERASYFRNDSVFADIMIRGHRHTLPIEGKAFAKWLLHQFFLEKKKAPAGSAIKTAIRTLAAIAEFGPETPRHRIQLRAAEVDEKIYIDLGDESWRCVEVDADGWRIIDAPLQIRFRRTPSMRPLAVPQHGGHIDLLKPFVNLPAGDFVLFVAVLLDAFRSGKHPILNLVGEFGTAKSTLAKIYKKLTDPDETELRSLPDTIRDIFIAVNSARVRAWDNVSKIEPRISDALCQLSDGSGFGTRKLYTDEDEFRVAGSRSIVLTGLVNCATRPDLASRTVLLALQPIEDDARKSEVKFWADFNEVRPLILGALFDALAHGLRNLPNIHLDHTSRMADFELFGHACEAAYAEVGSFATALAANAVELNEALIEDDVVAKAIIAFMDTRKKWSGTTTALLNELTLHALVDELQVSKQQDWPKDATRFSKRVRTVAATLRKAGVEVSFGTTPDRAKTRTITLTKTPAADAADAADATKKNQAKKAKKKNLASAASAASKHPKPYQRTKKVNHK
jgi:hypothetical protein